MRLNIAPALSNLCEYGRIAHDYDDARHYKSKTHQKFLWRIPTHIPIFCNNTEMKGCIRVEITYSKIQFVIPKIKSAILIYVLL